MLRSSGSWLHRENMHSQFTCLTISLWDIKYGCGFVNITSHSSCQMRHIITNAIYKRPLLPWLLFDSIDFKPLLIGFCDASVQFSISAEHWHVTHDWSRRLIWREMNWELKRREEKSCCMSDRPSADQMNIWAAF